MIRITLFAAALFIAAAPLAAGPEIGKAAPGFTAADTAGVDRSLSDFLGKKVILEWTNHDCPYVRKHYESGNMQALQRETTDDGIVWLSVISSAPGKQGYVDSAQADELTRLRKASPTAVLLDPEGAVGKLYGARTTPHMYIVDEKGTLVYAGGIDDRPTSRQADIEGSTNYVRQALAEIDSGKPVSAALTRPYGCSVKYP